MNPKNKKKIEKKKTSVSWWLWTELYGTQEGGGGKQPVPAAPSGQKKKKMEASTQQTAIPVSDGELVGPADGDRRWVDVARCAATTWKEVEFSWQCPFSDLAWPKLLSSYTAFPNVIFFKLFYLQKYKKVLWSHFSFFFLCQHHMYRFSIYRPAVVLLLGFFLNSLVLCFFLNLLPFLFQKFLIFVLLARLERRWRGHRFSSYFFFCFFLKVSLNHIPAQKKQNGKKTSKSVSHVRIHSRA